MEEIHALENVNHARIRTSQITLIILNTFAFVLDASWLVVSIVLIMLVGVLRKKPAFGFVHTFVLKPLKLAADEILLDNREPHQFAQLLGTIFLAVGSAFLILGFTVVGWSFIWLVIALAALNAFGGFCVGCAIYYWLGRLQVSGFDKPVPPGTTPGRRPGG